MLRIAHLILLFEGPDVPPDGLQLLFPGALNHIVRAPLLVGCDEVRMVDARQGRHLFHVGHQLPLQLKVQHLRSKPASLSA